MSYFRKILCCIDKPFEILCWITCCPVQKSDFNLIRFYCYPLTGIYFFIWVFSHQWYNQWYLKIGLPLCVIMYIIFWRAYKYKKTPKWFYFFTFLGTFGGLMWLYVLSQILMDFLNAQSSILAIDSTFLGATILALGNSIPNAVVTFRLVKQEVGTMALKSLYTTQLVSQSFGFGLSMLIKSQNEGPIKFNLFIEESS